MKRCEVLIPFHLIATDTIHVPGDIIEISEEQLAKIQAINVNMVAVLGDVEEGEKSSEDEKPKRKKAKKQ